MLNERNILINSPQFVLFSHYRGHAALAYGPTLCLGLHVHDMLIQYNKAQIHNVLVLSLILQITNTHAQHCSVR